MMKYVLIGRVIQLLLKDATVTINNFFFLLTGYDCCSAPSAGSPPRASIFSPVVHHRTDLSYNETRLRMCFPARQS